MEQNNPESRKEWLLGMMKRSGAKNSHRTKRQYWRASVIKQKLDYLHHNPVEAGFVFEP